jgi:NAD+ diphosphatase
MSDSVISAAVAVLVNHKNEVLVVLRSDRVSSFRGFWCFPGGTIEKGEQANVAAARECKEEIGLAINPSDLIFIGEKLSRKVNVSYFVCDRFFGSISLNEECSDSKWIDPIDLDDLMAIPIPKDVIESIISYCNN